MQLNRHDLRWALRRIPSELKVALQTWAGRVFVGGGFLRAIVAGEKVSDIDVFAGSTNDAYTFAELLVKLRLKLTEQPLTDEQQEKIKSSIYETDNAFTLRCFHPAIQIIHRWTFPRGEEVANSFDFTICCAVLWFSTLEDNEGHWTSYCHDSFYQDLAAKRLVYLSPERNEDAGGSMLRVLKYYQKGYRIPLDSLGAVMARMVEAVKLDKLGGLMGTFGISHEQALAKVLTGMLVEVDPSLDPEHEAHLPTIE